MAKLRFPAEWEPHRALWTAWPYRAHEWGLRFEAARDELVAFIAACSRLEERVRVLVRAEDEQDLVERLTQSATSMERVELIQDFAFGDSWLRDTLPIFVHSEEGLLPVNFRFNGWGDRFYMEGDSEVGQLVGMWTAARKESLAPASLGLVLEGGSIESDGEGTILTTEQCLLNENRNPGCSAAELEEHLLRGLGAGKVLWLKRGLLNDHTDGHIDTLVRFVGPGRVLCMRPSTQDDPNRDALDEIYQSLIAMVDGRGRKLEVQPIPSPGRIEIDGSIVPASYANFVLTNRGVIVPTYGVAQDQEAVAALGALFPDRQVVGLSARAIVEAGGAFHCLTQQQPL